MFRASRFFPALLAGLAPASRGQSVPSAAGEIDRVRLLAEALRDRIEAVHRAAGALRVSVNRQEIPSAAIERTLVYLRGRDVLDRTVLDFLVADEIERRRRTGESLQDLGIGTGDVLEEIEAAKRRLAS
ncbi:MAG TPA: hypothetical protein VKF62_03405, partial [Planctomycetota bacterium]|nr:hypothetical protein [Planctomycetota bacterium]